MFIQEDMPSWNRWRLVLVIDLIRGGDKLSLDAAVKFGKTGNITQVQINWLYTADVRGGETEN